MSKSEIRGFGARLRQLREQRGLTQEDLAKAIDTDWMLISRYEREVNLPAAEKIVRLARALHVTTDALLRGDRSGEEPIEFKSIRLYERFRALDGLPREDQETVVRLVDAVLAKHKLEHLADEVRKTA